MTTYRSSQYNSSTRSRAGWYLRISAVRRNCIRAPAALIVRRCSTTIDCEKQKLRSRRVFPKLFARLKFVLNEEESIQWSTPVQENIFESREVPIQNKIFHRMEQLSLEFSKVHRKKTCRISEGVMLYILQLCQLTWLSTASSRGIPLGAIDARAERIGSFAYEMIKKTFASRRKVSSMRISSSSNTVENSAKTKWRRFTDILKRTFE